MFAIEVRAVIGTRQFGHSWSSSAHEAQARKWLHGPKRTVRGASASMQIVHRRRSSSASFSRLTSASAPAVASVAALERLRAVRASALFSFGLWTPSAFPGGYLLLRAFFLAAARGHCDLVIHNQLTKAKVGQTHDRRVSLFCA